MLNNHIKQSDSKIGSAKELERRDGGVEVRSGHYIVLIPSVIIFYILLPTAYLHCLHMLYDIYTVLLVLGDFEISRLSGGLGNDILFKLTTTPHLRRRI